MYCNSGYLNNSRTAFLDKSKPLIVGSCGTYRLNKVKRLPTWRPKGRIDYQLLYIASGKAHFEFEKGKEQIVPAGHMVLYRPKEMQKYTYYVEDKPEVYWIHFTGSDVKKMLKKYGLPSQDHVFYTGTSSDYQRLFRTMIQELQLCKPHYEDTLALQLQELFITISRYSASKTKESGYAQKEIESAIQYFNENYSENIRIEDYAASKHMSVSWFIRNFKQYNKITPLNYILSIRIANAKNLLENTSYNVSQIAEIVGYDNPLYFSRLFHKQVGFSPSEYRKLRVSSGELE